jgi:hypothetical protein
VACSPRQLEDWRRVGLVPKGHRRSLGRGLGTEVVYPDDMAERCRQVAKRMRRGQPWQMVAFSLFAGGIDLPEETIRTAYRWALTIETPADSDELDVAERGVDQLLSTVAGRRLEGLVAAQVKRSGVAQGESPGAVARSVLTNLFLVQLGGEVANEQAIIELLAGMGVPIAELPPDERIQAARFMDAVLSAFSFDELAGIAQQAPVDELRAAIPVVAKLVEVMPPALRALVPGPVAELLPPLLAPVVVQVGRITASLDADQQGVRQSEPALASQRTATMDPMPLPSPSDQAEREMTSA